MSVCILSHSVRKLAPGPAAAVTVGSVVGERKALSIRTDTRLAYRIILQRSGDCIEKQKIDTNSFCVVRRTKGVAPRTAAAALRTICALITSK